MGPIPARELARHFAERGDALTDPSTHCPTALVRLLRQLEADGLGEAVTQLACAICGPQRPGASPPDPPGPLLHVVREPHHASVVRPLRTGRPHRPPTRGGVDLQALLQQGLLRVLGGVRRRRAAQAAKEPARGRQGTVPVLHSEAGAKVHPMRKASTGNDDQLPLDVRIAGGLIGLYALPVVRLVELTTDRFERTEDNAYLTIERNSVLLPPKLALLIEEQVARPTVRSMLRPPQDGRLTYLLPGVPAHRPITAQRIVNKLRNHGLEVISARNTAMLEAVADLPPIVISDLFGVSATSAHRWARFAQDSWADYLAACTDDDAGPSEGS